MTPIVAGTYRRLEKQMSVEMVTWRDAHFYVDQAKAKNEYLVRTVGWVKEGPRFLRIVSEKTPDGNRAVTYVPNECVIDRKVLS